MFLSCYFGLSASTRPTLQKQWTTLLQHCSCYELKYAVEEKQVRSQTRMRWWGDWKGNSRSNKVCVHACVLRCIFWAWLCETRVARWWVRPTFITSLSAEEVSSLGKCASFGGQDMHWQRRGGSTLCLAVTLYLPENNNTLSLISATDRAPGRGPLPRCDYLSAAGIVFAACERSNNNKYRPVAHGGECTQLESSKGHTEAFTWFTHLLQILHFIFCRPD